MTQPLHILGGKVYDPANRVDGQIRDILVAGDRIVAALPPNSPPPQRIDAAGLIVMPGGIDMHAHIASTGVNLARQLQPAGNLVPSTFDTGRQYAALGYTTVIEAAVAPSDARHAHLQLDDTPHLDAGILVLCDNHELIIDLLDAGRTADAEAVVQEILHRTGAMGMKVVNPAGVAAWRRDAGADQIDSIDQPIPGRSTRGVTPRQVLDLLTSVSEELNLPHPTHVHGNRLGAPGNFKILFDTIAAFAGRRAHLAHLQFYGYGQTDKGGFTSAATDVCNFLARHPRVTADIGMVMFGPAFTITADTPLEHRLWRTTGSPGRPAVFIESEREAAVGVMPASYSPKNRINSLQWAIGLELLLLSENLEQICLSIDHPNGGSFHHFPAIIASLMNKSARDEALAKAHKYATAQSTLKDIKREMTLYEIAALTRSGPAKMLGLADKGRLSPGADADICLYHDNTADPAAMFARPRMVFKAGRLIAQDGKSLSDTPGRRLRAAIAPHPRGQELLADWFAKRGSHQFTQFGLHPHELATMSAVQHAKP